MLDWQDTVDDAAKFLDALRCDLAEQQIQVFTEAGQAVLLPVGCDTGRPRLHGRSESRPRLRRRDPSTAAWLPLSSLLDDGDVVEIITRGNSGPLGGATGPAREWLEFVKSPQARLRDQPLVRRRREPVATVEQRVRLGRATIGLALREQGRRLANERPLRDLADQISATPTSMRCWSRWPTTGCRRPRWPTVWSRSSTVRSDAQVGAGAGVARYPPGAGPIGCCPMTVRARLRAVAYRAAYRLPGSVRRRLVRIAMPTYIIGAVVLVRDSDAPEPGRILLLRQPPGHGWSIPGGLLDRGESPIDARRPRAARGGRHQASTAERPGRARRRTPSSTSTDAGSTASSRRACRPDTPLTVDGAEVLEAAWYRLDALPPLTVPTARLLGRYGIGPYVDYPEALI